MAEVNIDNLKSESPKSKNEKIKVTPIVSKDKIVSAKKSTSKRFFNNFLEEAGEDIKDYIIFDKIVPGIKDMILDSISMALIGEPLSRGRRSQRSDRRYYYEDDYCQYSDYYDRRSDRRNSRDRYRGKLDYRDVIVKDRASAEDIIDELKHEIWERGQVSVAYFYELLDLDSEPQDNNWGWTRESDVGIRRVTTGYLIDLARARYLY